MGGGGGSRVCVLARHFDDDDEPPTGDSGLVQVLLVFITRQASWPGPLFLLLSVLDIKDPSRGQDRCRSLPGFSTQVGATIES